MRSIRREIPLHLMLIPGIVLVVVFSYVPILGNVIAFMDFKPLFGLRGSPWVGLRNFIYVFTLPDTLRVIWNTIYISTLKITSGLVVPLIIALLLNEVSSKTFNRMIQTAIYLPHFMSWIILGGIFIDLLSMKGILNQVLGLLGLPPIYFLGSNRWFPIVLVATDVWKDLGFNTIIFLAALTGIDPGLYEAAVVDGAGRWRQTWHVTIPGLRSTFILLATLSLGWILSAGFEQVFTLYSPQVYQSGDILDTFVFRLGLVQSQYGPATAVGLFKSAVSFILISLSYFLASRYAGYRIF